ncbi:MAG: DEAD/DEAH box helicase, ATP-dependent helicase Lhr and Lhr-like protein helicase [Nitrosopumilales archaeon]|nr:MAG: DEAD/DEAH box helicase, ATP-dependent helicase Lhr and Lhr-like protein helicase [Nitrosopumilales archaeon]
MSELELDLTRNLLHSSFLKQKFRSLGFEKLTEIQKKAIPIIYQKKDCLLIAPTGSGKTEATVIPIFTLLAKSKKVGKIKALYITPLRALNRDVFRRIIRYAEKENLSIAIRHGDTSQSARKRITNSPPDVLITTPETLVILLAQQRVLESLSELEWIIVDEVHELVGNERGAQLSVSLERLQINSKINITRVGLSATVGNKREAAKFMVGTKRKCKIIQDNSVRKYDVDIEYVNGTISDVVKFVIEYVSKNYPKSTVLFFTNTRGESEFITSMLREKSELNIELHHGSLSQQVREETEETLRKGKAGIVVCTSSLELGLDIGSVDLVIHYGSPRQVSKLIQRIGRSRHNRELSAKGLLVTNSADDEFEAKAILLRVREKSIEDQKIHDLSLDVLAHHLVGLNMQLGKVSVKQAQEIIKQAFPFRNLPLEDLIGVLEILNSNSILYFNRKEMVFSKKVRAFKYYFENLSTIPDVLKFKVVDVVSNKIIGSLDQRFVGDFGESGNVFVLRGMQWKILNVDETSLKVNVEPVRLGGITIPYWEGENIPVDYKTAKKVGLLRSKVKTGSFSVMNKLIDSLKLLSIPNHNTIVAESVKNQNIVVIHCCFGTKINSTLSTILSSMISARTGYLVDSRSDAYRIVLSSKGRISKGIVIDILQDQYDLSNVVSASLGGTYNLNWRTWCVAKKFGIVGRSSIYDKKSARFLYEKYSNTTIVKEALRELFHDKYDLENTSVILKKIKEKAIGFEWIEVEKFSKLAEPLLDRTTKYYSTPANIDKGILDLVKTRLSKTKHRLLCLRCGKWQKLIETKEFKDKLICPHCRARQVTATFNSDYDLMKIVQKKRMGKKISSEENHRFTRAWKVSSLLENFGGLALTVLSGYGVGADTAARILRNMVDEENLLKQIYQAEKLYVATRGFWDT